MRPVKLSVAGMRSYRARRTLDFTDRTLMAILGDTGSGKSSLLEALFGVLYGGSTWDARGLGALIADGVQTLQIELEFQARGNIYTVSRSASRKNYPPSKHVFDGPGGEHLDGERDVNRRIVELVGLTGQEFLRVVILPQGRFGQLLQGTSGDRTPILRGILGLGVLDRVRDVADRQAGILGVALEPIVAARARLYPDPQAIADAADALSEQQSRTVERLAAAAEALRALDAAITSVSAAVPVVSAALELVTATELAPVLATLAEADVAEKEATAQEQGLAAEIAELEKRDAALKADLAAATAAGITPASIATMSAELTSVATTLGSLAQKSIDQAKETAELATVAAQLAIDAEAVRTSTETAKSRKFALGDRESAAETVAEQARRQNERMAAIGLALDELAAQQQRLTAAVRTVLTRAQTMRQARSQEAIAAAARSTAAGELGMLRASNAAAHVASQHAAGQPCPVCDQTLPASFSPPEIVGEQVLADAVELAESRAKEAAAEERSTERAMDAEQNKLLNDVATAATAATAVTRLLSPVPTPGPAGVEEIVATVGATVQSILDLPADQPTTAEQLTHDVAALTGSLRSLTGVDAAEQLAAAPAAAPTLAESEAERAGVFAALRADRDEVQALTAMSMRLEARHGAACDALDRRRRDHEFAAARTVQVAQNLARDIRRLDPLVSEPLVSALGLTAADPGAALLVAGELPADLVTNLHGELSRRQAELDQLNDQREAVLVELRRLDGRRTQLQQDRMELVDRPRATARRTGERANGSAVRLMSSLSQLHENWGNLSRTAHAPPLPTLSADFTATADLDVGDEQLSAEFAHLGARLEVATSSAAEVLAAARVAVQVADRNAQEQLAAAGATTSDDLAEQLSEARHELRHAIARRQRATAQVPLAEGLDIGLSELTFQLKVLRQVKDLLSPSNFPQFVVQQRQVALLRIASSLFGQLTRAGYGFGEDFMIVDRRTGQPRHPKTLSGGETFLASLALALALVEISNRSGGQLDCLFLDEGFGSLDSAILGEALDVLRLQATGGRLVGVISHLHAVAAELDDVLVVTKEVEGSSFRWLDPQERDAYLLDEAAAGLLS